MAGLIDSQKTLELFVLTVGSVSREKASLVFPFLHKDFRARRAAIRDFTHRYPEFVFWIAPDGRLYNAQDSHLKHPPKGFAHIIHDEPLYGGFFRGRVARQTGPQLVVVYCNETDLDSDVERLTQFLTGLSKIPIPVSEETLVISDNADIFGTIRDLRGRVLHSD